MVSFQCDACTEVVKKPKLDKHGMQCNSSFTCIDCSTTFNGPAEYKGHTQCISEAEKYQKGLYKGPKNQQQSSGPRGNVNPRANSANNAPAQSWSRGGGAASAQNSYGRNYNRYAGTGANETPLGTPIRMSPVDPTPIVPIEAKKANVETTVTPAKITEKPAEGKKDKKDKKRKATSATEEQADANGEARQIKKAKTVEESAAATTPTEASTKVEKKSKKEKKEKRSESATNGKAGVEDAAAEGEKKNQKKSKGEDKERKEKKHKKSKSEVEAS